MLVKRLKSKKEISRLFTAGKFLFAGNLKVKIRVLEKNEAVIFFGVSVPKRLIKKAVVRNLLKRRVREAFRLEIKPLYKKLLDRNIPISVLFIYSSSNALPYPEIKKDLVLLLQKIELHLFTADGED